MNTIVNQEGFSFGWSRSLATSTPTQDEYFSPRDWQNNAFDQLRAAPYMILNAPMGSGKSWLMCLLSAYKLDQNIDMRCIVAVPQTIIAPGFASAKLLMPGGEKLLWHPKHNLCSKEKSKGTVQYVIKWLERDHDSINDRVLLCTHTTLVNAYKKLKAENRLDLLKRLLLWIDEAHHVKNIAMQDIEDGVDSNEIGKLVQYLLEHKNHSNQLGMTTASFFRGDRCSLLTAKMEKKFQRFNLPYDTYLGSMEHLESFSFDFLLCGPDYSNAIEIIAKQRKGKDIIYIPHTTSRHSTGHKHQEVENIITKYKSIYGDTVEKRSNGLIVLTENEFKILDLVDEKRDNKKIFLNDPVLKTQRDSLDVIIAMGMFKEGANWIHADRSIIVGARTSLVDILQMIGRLFRDTEGKKHVEVFQLLPFSLDQQDDKNFSQNLNNYLKAIFASLILEDILKPVVIKAPGAKKNKDDSKNGQVRNNFLSSALPDDVQRLSLLENVYKQLLSITATIKAAETSASILWDEYQKFIPTIFNQYGVDDPTGIIAKQVWAVLTRPNLRLKGLDVEDIDFDILQNTNPLEFLLRYTSGICNIDTFKKLREAIQLNRPPAGFRSFESAREFVRGLNLQSETEWRLYISGKMPHLPSLPMDIPKAPWVAYEHCGWITWGDFLGTDLVAPRLRKYRSYELAREFVHKLELKRKDDWFLYVKGEFPELPSLPQDIPATPDKTYKRSDYQNKWCGWGDFLGTGTVSNQERSTKFRSYSDAQEFVRPLNLKSSGDWRKYIKGAFPHLPTLPSDIPKKPDEFYEEFEWPTFLGCAVSKLSSRRDFWSFEKARAFVRQLKLKNQADWIEYCADRLPHLPRKPIEIPSNPQKKYLKSGWKGFADWMGYG